MKCLLALVFLLLLACCTRLPKKGYLTLGSHVQFDPLGKPFISGGTTFSKKDTVYLMLSVPEAFNTPSLSFHLYQLFGRQKLLLENEIIQVDPTVKYLRNRFVARTLIKKYGAGEFLLQFYEEATLLAEERYRMQP